MQFIDLMAQQARIKEKIDARIQDVLGHGKYILGPEVKELETALAEYVGVKYAVGVSSGTDALLMPLMAYGIGQGDAVFCPTFTFIATAEVVELLGATPVFVDINERDFNIDVAKLEEAILKVKEEGKLKLKAIIPVDLFGQAADYDAIMALAKKYDMIVIEDAAQGFGGEIKGKMAGSFAHAAGTSFFPAKPLGTYGDGGMVFTEDKNIYEKLLSIRVHGKNKDDKYDNIRTGVNGRIDTLMAAILLPKFELFPEEIQLRQVVADRYNEGLKDVVKTPFVDEQKLSAWAQYTLVHENRDEVIEGIKSEGIPVAVYYPRPLHLQSTFQYLGYKEGDFPVSERLAKQVFSLPMHPYLTKEDQDQVIEVVRKYC